MTRPCVLLNVVFLQTSAVPAEPPGAIDIGDRLEPFVDRFLECLTCCMAALWFRTVVLAVVWRTGLFCATHTRTHSNSCKSREPTGARGLSI